MQFTRQVDHFSDCILHDRTPATPGEDGLADQLALEAVYKSVGINSLVQCVGNQGMYEVP